MQGIITEINGAWHWVKIIQENKWVQARMRGRLKIVDDDPIHSPTIPAVGDRVELSAKNGDVLIEHILERKSIFSRLILKQHRNQVMASNIDQLVIIASLHSPFVPFIFIDSLVVSAESENISILILLNKIDLYSKEDMQKAKKIQSLYEGLNYPCLLTQIKKCKEKEPLQHYLQHKSSLLVGFSGCGKSSLISCLFPEKYVFIGEVGSQNLGMHTTTFSTLFDLPFGGNIIDSPGIKNYYMPKMQASDLRMYFKDFLDIQANCSFVDCTHIHEKNCAVLKALYEKKIAEERYFTYKTNMEHLKKLHDEEYE